MSESINQLADLIMGIIQEKVDERIDQKVADLQEGVDTVAAFDIQDHTADILAIMEVEYDIDTRVADALSECTFTTTID